MASSQTQEIASRSEPFTRSEWITEFLPFDPLKDSTFAEFESGEQLYEFIGNYIAKQTDQSYRFSPIEGTSKATRILEKLARAAKKKAVNGDEKEEDSEDEKDKVKVCL